jgi:hypothetical protein
MEIPALSAEQVAPFMGTFGGPVTEEKNRLRHFVS